MPYFIYLFFIGAIFLIGFSLWGWQSQTIAIRSRLPMETPEIQKIKIPRYFVPLFFLNNFILEKLNLKQRVRQMLNAAHTKLTPEGFFTLKFVLMLGLSIATFFILPKVHPSALMVTIILGYIIPDLWLMRKISLRKQAIARFLPESIDLLGLCIEAGLDFTTAIDWIVRKTKHTPMIEELAFVLEEIKLGKSRSQALKDMSKRLNIQEVSSFVHSLVQAEQMGTPASEAFAIISEDTRMRRFHRGERFALKAPIKILIPLIFCILPVIAIVIGGPIMIQFMRGGLLKGF